MHLQSADTHPKVEAKQVELLRAAQPGRRIELAMRLTNMSYSLSLSNLINQHPDWSEQQCRLQLAEHLYGSQLIERVRNYLSKAK